MPPTKKKKKKKKKKKRVQCPGVVCDLATPLPGSMHAHIPSLCFALYHLTLITSTRAQLSFRAVVAMNNVIPAKWRIRESVDSLCRDGADAQYMQYLSKSRITSPQTRKKLI